MNTTILNLIRNDIIINKIANEFPSEKIYIVGGTVRDFYMGENSLDRDIIVCETEAKEFAQKLHKIFKSAYIPLDEENKIYRLVLYEKEDKNHKSMIDVTNPAGGSLEQDLRRRDLTINAIAVDIHTGVVVDIYGGIDDIKSKYLRCIEESNFLDDPLRLLRVHRFQALFDFKISTDTFSAICRHADLINKPAKERVTCELMKMFSGKYTDTALLSMDTAGLLEKIFPFVNELKQIPPNSHHHLDLFHHCIETVKQIQILYDKSPQRIKEHLDKIDFGGFSRFVHLKLAGFLHDIGKFSTWTIDSETGRHRFIKHDDEGAKIVKPILKALCFSNKQINYLSGMIKNHIYPSQLMSSADVNVKAMTRYLRKLEEDVIDNIILAKADRLSARGKVITTETVKNNLKNLDRLMDFYFDSLEMLTPLPILLDGNDIMKILNIKPSRRLGELIKALREAQLSGDITTKDEAVEFINKLNRFEH